MLFYFFYGWVEIVRVFCRELVVLWRGRRGEGLDLGIDDGYLSFCDDDF